ncbi:MAG: hypothetical protein M1826_000277 [Phylliscum demangeonii]|nr:MAG: hypothetical protein M1826_000277 [Phylliscum demangeonii]
MAMFRNSHHHAAGSRHRSPLLRLLLLSPLFFVLFIIHPATSAPSLLSPTDQDLPTTVTLHRKHADTSTADCGASHRCVDQYQRLASRPSSSSSSSSPPPNNPEEAARDVVPLPVMTWCRLHCQPGFNVVLDLARREVHGVVGLRAESESGGERAGPASYDYTIQQEAARLHQERLRRERLQQQQQQKQEQQKQEQHPAAVPDRWGWPSQMLQIRQRCQRHACFPS